jgi:dipeptidyl aminopeptidase/acylaminoacyl peptidase
MQRCAREAEVDLQIPVDEFQESKLLRRRHIPEAAAALTTVFVVALSALVHAQNRHLVTLDDLTSLKYVDWEIGVSPSGETVAYVIDEQLWMVGTKQSVPHRIGQGTMPVWSPDGRLLAFYSSRTGTLQLWCLDLKTGQIGQITHLEGGIDPDPVASFSGWGGDPLRYRWSPDGRRIAFTSRAQVRNTGKPVRSTTAPANESSTIDENHLPYRRGDAPLILTNNTPPDWTLSNLFVSDSAASEKESERRPRMLPNQLFMIDAATKQIEQLTNDDGGYFNPDWSRDGRRIVCVSTEGRPMVGYGPDSSNLYSIDLVTGHKTALTTGPGQKRVASFSPDGKWIAYLSGRWTGITSVVVLPDQGGTPINVTANLDRNVFSYEWFPDSSSIIASYHDGASVRIARFNVFDRTVTRLTSTEAFCHPFAISRAGTLVWVQNDGSNPGVLYMAEPNGHDPRVVLDLYPQMQEWILGKQEIVRWKNSRGEEIEGLFIKPVNYQVGKSYPVIVDPYPGQVNSFFGGPMYGNQAFASEGYAVFFPNERTPHTWQNPVKDETYNEATRGPKGIRIMMDDLMSGIDALVERGLIDPHRMCLYGFSNGGGAVNQILTETDRFRCAVSTSGVGTDWVFSFFMSGNSIFPDLVGNVTPWNNPDTYTALSPVFHLNKVTTPLLLAVGDEEETEVIMLVEMYNGLRYLGRDVTLLRYPKQGHGFEGAALKDYWRRVNAFLNVHLRSDEVETRVGRK